MNSDPTNLVDPTGGEDVIEESIINYGTGIIQEATAFASFNACLWGQTLFIDLALEGVDLTSANLPSGSGSSPPASGS